MEINIPFWFLSYACPDILGVASQDHTIRMGASQHPDSILNIHSIIEYNNIMTQDLQ
jgi:hypothetical protein